jgi:hypothetical protein
MRLALRLATASSVLAAAVGLIPWDPPRAPGDAVAGHAAAGGASAGGGGADVAARPSPPPATGPREPARPAGDAPSRTARVEAALADRAAPWGAFEDASLRDVLRAVARRTGVTVRTAPEVTEDQRVGGLLLTGRLDGASAAQVLDLVTGVRGLDWNVVEGGVVVAPPALETRRFDVAGALARTGAAEARLVEALSQETPCALEAGDGVLVARGPARRLDALARRLADLQDEPAREVPEGVSCRAFDVRDVLRARSRGEPILDADALVLVVTSSVAPRSWVEPGRGARVVEGRLLVAAAPATLLEVEALLGHVRVAVRHLERT